MSPGNPSQQPSSFTSHDPNSPNYDGGDSGMPPALIAGLEQVLAEAISAPVIAETLYTEYCSKVGGKAFNGDPLPDWKTFSSDPSKKLQSDAWLSIAAKAYEIFNKPKPASTEAVKNETKP